MCMIKWINAGFIIHRMRLWWHIASNKFILRSKESGCYKIYCDFFFPIFWYKVITELWNGLTAITVHKSEKVKLAALFRFQQTFKSLTWPEAWLSEPGGVPNGRLLLSTRNRSENPKNKYSVVKLVTDNFKK